MVSRFFLCIQGVSGFCISFWRCSILEYICRFHTQITREITHENGGYLFAEILPSKKAFIADAISFDFSAIVC